MNPQEKRITLVLAAIYCFRMLGLFMILPIFSLYTHNMQFASASLIGLALGIYGLTQAGFQIPLAMLSDRIGRKPVIIFGLGLFIIGSITAAMSHTIYGIIIGRAIQGAGAIGSALMALVADTIHEENRLKAMAGIGMTIGLSFTLAMILGPIVSGFIGLTGIFWLTAILASIGILTLGLVPTPATHRLHRDSEAVFSQFAAILSNRELLRLNIGIFSLHAILMSFFIILPIILLQYAHLSQTLQWKMYLPTLLVALILILPFIMIAEKKRLLKPLFCAAVILLTLSQCLFYFFHANAISIGILLCLFFTAFTFLEACLPSLVSKIAPAGSKGTAMGMYSGSQFLGIFVGGAVGGIIVHHFSMGGIFIFTGILGTIWIILALTMKNPLYLSSKIITIDATTNKNYLSTLQANLLKIKGIKEAVLYPDEGVVYLKIDKKNFSETALNDLLAINK